MLELAAAGRISGTGALVTRPGWPLFAPRLADLGGAVDVGLHLNLTLGAPLGPMPRLSPDGRFPPLGRLMRLAFSGRLSGAEARAEIGAEIGRQIDAFAGAFGRLPDFVDGHQHVQVLPGVSGPLLAAIASHWGETRPWLRDPFDTPGTLLARGVAVPKALVLAGLSVGWSRRLRRGGLDANRGFSGVSAFDPARDFGHDLARFLSVPGPLHLVMCHPGHVDDELAGLDPVVATR
ncbi:ChbG/HpnK family deacetylase, partial [Nostoc sp. NIES-2111]